MTTSVPPPGPSVPPVSDPPTTPTPESASTIPTPSKKRTRKLVPQVPTIPVQLAQRPKSPWWKTSAFATGMCISLLLLAVFLCGETVFGMMPTIRIDSPFVLGFVVLFVSAVSFIRPKKTITESLKDMSTHWWTLSAIGYVLMIMVISTFYPDVWKAWSGMTSMLWLTHFMFTLALPPMFYYGGKVGGTIAVFLILLIVPKEISDVNEIMNPKIVLNQATAKSRIEQVQPQQTVVEVYPIVAPVGEWSPEYDVERKHFECRRDKTKSLVIMKNGVAPEIVCVPGTEVMLGDNIKTLRFKSGESTPLKFQMKVWE